MSDILALLDEADAELAALAPAVTDALDAKQADLDAATEIIRERNPDVQRSEVHRSDETRVEAARQHLATVRMHVAEIRHTQS